MERKAVGKSKSPKEEKVEVKIAPEVTENTPTYYCNYVSVTHSPYDFSLTLVRLPTSLKPEQIELVRKQKPLPIEAAFQIIVSPRLIPGLINALNEQRKKYEARLGEIKEGK